MPFLHDFRTFFVGLIRIGKLKLAKIFYFRDWRGNPFQVLLVLQGWSGPWKIESRKKRFHSGRTCTFERRSWQQEQKVRLKNEIQTCCKIDFHFRAKAEVSFCLAQYIKFHAKSKSRKMTAYSDPLEHVTVQPGDSDSFVNVPFEIPAVPPSELELCGIIDISYRIVMSISLGLVSGFKVTIPIEIGNIPIRQVLNLQ